MIVGTAGHIDHGKTALLRALTGVEGDRRPAERERGITIDLGYVYADLGDGSLTGFIDVPGHERFVHNMLAGASGIDLVLLVVAADDGVMPQTREHLAIVELLGIPRARVALTKADRVSPQRLAEARAEVESLLAAGPLAGAPIYPVSSVTGEGVDALRQALAAAAGEVHARSTRGGFRLAVDRAFSVSGAGLVVTGTAFSGSLKVGDELLLGNAGRPVRVRGLHAQNRAAEQAHAGQRVAVNLAGDRLGPDQVKRGDWLLAPEQHAPTTRIDIDLQLLPGEPRALAHWTPLHVHLGAQDVTGRVALLEDERLAPGERAFAQLVLNAPVQTVHGDRLVLRDQSAQRTLGGGRVLDPFAPARNRRSLERLAQLQALRGEGLEQALPVLLQHADNGLDPKLLARQFNRPRESWRLPAELVEITTRGGPRLFTGERWRALGEQLLQALARFHVEQPDELGPDRDRLRRYAFAQLERPVFIALLEQALAGKTVESSGPWLHLPDHRVQLGTEDEALRQRLWPLLLAGAYDPPWTRDLARELQVDEAAMRLLLRKLARLGQLHQVVKDLFYPDETIRQLARQALQLHAEQGLIRAAAFRDRIGIGRKRSIQLLEYFDRIGFTRRFGNERRVREGSALALGADVNAERTA
ncbi:selenocysteine-specific translation elongation factor SelB [Pseudomonas delhiensis]|uniref:Selenocysteine-specific elongation factor n=1 Tax=Pseudomonas delhiensis TaxID=366289 RepID=A0A239F6J7_9PSED|nr:selenocysteine-specific translation elongation factor [Pseudomonas delhiensis]SDI12973.1 selenocysteine-specific translation elongation factor SelB [Pseudomonas delhiensis]SNS52670.1 selenocysteine-specific translation elongation factor SelB [Pseudomonas delhiensis]